MHECKVNSAYRAEKLFEIPQLRVTKKLKVTIQSQHDAQKAENIRSSSAGYH